MLFSSSSAGSVTYSTITTGGGATQWAASVSTNAVSAVTITSLTNGAGFSFNFDGTAYSAINISNNGFITFGATAPTAATTNPISAATGFSGAIAGYAWDLVASTFTGASPAILYQVIGTAPNREFVVQFQDLARFGFTGAAADRMNFQIRLVETSNVIKIVYGTWNASTTTSSATNFGQVGLRGESTADFHTRMVAASTYTNNTSWNNSGGSGDIGTTLTQGADDQTAGINCMRFNSTTFPSTTSTLTYTWTPIASIFYKPLPYSQNFDSWVNLQALKDAPAASGVITWPSSGHLSWRNITESIYDASWYSSSGNFAAPSTQAGAGCAIFDQFHAKSGTKGVMDFFLNLSPAGTKVVDFYVRNPGTTNANDILQVYLSTDGGVSFLQLGTDIAAPTPSTATAWSAKQTLTLGASVSASCILRFQAVSDWGTSLENLAIDEVSVYVQSPCTTPTAQPSSLNFSGTTTTALNGSFTAASPAPSGYIVFRSTSSAAPAPLNGNIYTAAGSPYTFSGNQYTVINPSGTGPVTFTESGLTANTRYYYTVMSINNSCGGAPFYLTASPLANNAWTCTNAPATLTGAAASTTSATITFSTVTGATSYILEYSIAGANSWVIAAPAPVSSPYTLTGLSSGTVYDIRLQGPNSNCGTLKTTSGAFTTPCTSVTLNYPQKFNATTIPACWSQQFVTGASAIQYVASNTNPGITPQEGADYVYWNSYGITSGNQTRLVSPPIVTTGSANVNAKFYWFHDNSAYTTGAYADEGVTLQYSTNGTTWIDVQAVPRLLTGTNGWTLYDIPLPAGAGNIPTLYVGFLFTSRLGDNCALDNLLVHVPAACTTPTTQPTVLTLGSVTDNSLSGSFTAASPAPTGGYVVLRSTSRTVPTLTNGTTYTIGNTYTISGNSYIVVSNSSIDNFTEGSLTANTKYYYFIFSFNGSCIGAPYYLNTAPLADSVLTCTAQPATLTGVAINSTSATITFSAVPGATSYILRYRVNGAPTFNIASPAPVSSPYTLAGLSPGTVYDIRLQGPNSNCGNNKTTNNAFTTPCSVVTSLPWSEKFDALTSTGAGILPPCWLNVTGGSAFTSSNAAYTTYHNPYSDPYYVTIYYGTTASYMWTPAFSLTAGVSYDFSFRWVGDGYSGWTGDALYNTSQTSGGATSLGASFVTTATTTTTAYTTKTYTFIPATTGTYYFATKVLSNFTPDYLGFDDYSLKLTPPCNNPGTATATSTAICGTSGSTTITATDYSVSGAGLSYQWQSSTDNFTGNIVNIGGATNPALLSTGTISSTMYYRLRVTCTALGAATSNIVTVSVTNPQILTTMPATRCGIGTANLQATSTAGTTLNWYAAASGGTPLGTGSPFTTPSISATTNFYVAAAVPGSSSSYVGPVSPSAQGGTLDNQTVNWRVYFDVIQPTTLQSVDIFPLTSGQSATLYIFNPIGTLVKSVPYVTSVSGGNTAQTIPINLAVSVGAGYNIYANQIPAGGLKRNISGAIYPYTSSSINITGNGYDNTYYMCYYNWKFSTGCESGRIAVAVTVTPPPALAIDAATATICSGGSIVVNVTGATAGNFSSYSWSPVTGAIPGGTPSGASVTLSPTATTNYTVSGSTAGGCVNQSTVAVTVNPAPPVTTNAAICSGGAATITASSVCTNFTNSGTSIPGSWDAATDPIAIQPVIFLPNSTTCEFDPDGNTMNYTTTTFQVSLTGTYTFVMDPTTAYDAMGYIVTGAFVPGTCPGSGNWVVGDDDSGPTTFEPLMTANLTAGVTYTLITTCYYFTSGTVTDSYNWTITPPAGGQLTTQTGGTLQWYTAASGGTLIGTGTPFNPVGVAGGIPSNTSVGSYTYYATCSNNNTCRTAANYVIGSTGQWIGGTSTDWSLAANWCGGVPSTLTDGTIVSGAPYMPVLATGTGGVKNLTVNPGATLGINNAVMQVAGNITATNSITASAGTVELVGGTAQSLSGSSFTNRTIQNLKASNSVNVSSVTNDTLKITGALSFGAVNGKAFNSGDNVTLVSNAVGTARVADITNGGINNNTITGRFVVERYIPARRAWRLLTTPIATGAQTINQCWQEGVGGNWALDPRPGYGTHVTGGPARTTAQGFDQGPLNASIYGHTGTAWNYLPLTTGDLVTDRQGWMLFIRGSRAINLPLSTISTTPDNTVLRPTGAIKYGLQPTITNAAGGFTVVGNPYPAPVNFNAFSRSGVIGGSGGNAYYLWDPYLGGANGVGAFVTFSWNGSSYLKSIDVGVGNSSITNTGVIPSGAAMMVNLSPGGSIGIDETDKTTDVPGPSYVFRPAAAPASLRTTLYILNADSSKGVLDGNLISFSDMANTALDNEDALKPNNFFENFGLLREGAKIAVERRGFITGYDTVFYLMWNMKQKTYQLEITAAALNLPADIIAYFEDAYLHQKTVLNIADTNRFSFTITADSATAAKDRFRLVFKSSSVVPVMFTQIKAYSENRNIAVEWSVQNEINIIRYEVERSLDGIHFSPVNNTNADGGNLPYNWLDVQPAVGDNFYRIKSIDNRGNIRYSLIVKVNIGKDKPFISIYPNPVTDNVANLFFNAMPQGLYNVEIYDASGQLMFAKPVIHTAGSSSESIKLNKKLAKAVYQLEIIKKDGNKESFKLIIE